MASTQPHPSGWKKGKLSRSKTTFKIFLNFSDVSQSEFRIPNGSGSFKRETSPEDLRYDFDLMI